MRPLPTRSLSIRLDVPVMISSASALIVMGSDGLLSPLEGALMLAAAGAYTVALVRLSRRESPMLKREFAHEYGDHPLQAGHGWRKGSQHLVVLLAGMALTVLGAELLVGGAIEIARTQGVSDAFIGLTIVAIGTSAPELVTTLVATWRNDRDVAIGNLIGSSIYNILVILGLTMVASPDGLVVSQALLWIDLPLAALVAMVCLPVFRSQRMVSRREGACFVAAYMLYLGSLLSLRA
jgi:cation:H+ antiporter